MAHQKGATAQPVAYQRLSAFGSDALTAIRLLGVAVASGGFAGFLAGGIGSRVAMRIVAVMAGADAVGLRTENGNIVGDITIDGTVFLLVAGTFIGFFGGLAYLAFRVLIPFPARWTHWRGFAFGITLFAALGGTIVDPENVDFRLFGSPVVNVALFALIFPLYGVIADWAFGRIDRFMPRRRPSEERNAAAVLVTGAASAGLLILVTVLIGGAPVAFLAALYVGVAWAFMGRGWSCTGAAGRVARVAIIYGPVLAAISLGAFTTGQSVNRIFG